MARKQKQPVRHRNINLPGSFYQRNGRWWWKVQLPGEKKSKNRALKPIGAKFATTNFNVACEVACNLWEAAVYRQDPKNSKIRVSPVQQI